MHPAFSSMTDMQFVCGERPPSRFHQKIREGAEAADKAKLVRDNGRTNQKIKSSDPWMDQLLPNGKYERKPQADRWTSADQNADCHMETVEDREKTLLGTSKTRSTPVDGEAIGGICRPLSSGCKDYGIAPHKQRNPRKTRTSKLFGLLFELNRRVPNGTHGGVRGART